jgi:hypothetical protein
MAVDRTKMATSWVLTTWKSTRFGEPLYFRRRSSGMILAAVFVRAWMMNNEDAFGRSAGSVVESAKPMRRAISAIAIATRVELRRDLRCAAAVLIRTV